MINSGNLSAKADQAQPPLPEDQWASAWLLRLAATNM
jgi:hypothetical protein